MTALVASKKEVPLFHLRTGLSQIEQGQKLKDGFLLEMDKRITYLPKKVAKKKCIVSMHLFKMFTNRTRILYSRKEIINLYFGLGVLSLINILISHLI